MVYEKIKTRFTPNSEVAEMDIEEDLRRIKLAKTCDPNKLLVNIAVIEVQYECVLVAAKKASVVI